MKKYSPQCGPNLVFYESQNEPDCAVTHKGCGGMFMQILGPANQRNCEKPDDTPGKVFCSECGHKVGKAVAAALKTGRGQEHFYFPDRHMWSLRSHTYIDKSKTVRFWEWRHSPPELHNRPEVEKALARVMEKMKKRPVKKLRSQKPMYAIKQPSLSHPASKRKFNAQGPFGGNCDMASREGKYIISYRRKPAVAAFWFLVLNKDIWSEDLAQEIRELVRVSTFSGPEEFLDQMANHARSRGKSRGGDSFQITSSLEGAEGTNF